MTEYANDSKLRTDLEQTFTREALLAARAGDVPITITPGRARIERADRFVTDITADFGFEPEELRYRCRKRHQMVARGAVCYVLHELYGLSWVEVRNVLGDIRHPRGAAYRARDNHPDVVGRVEGFARNRDDDKPPERKVA